MKPLRLWAALLLTTVLFSLLGSPASAVIFRVGPKDSWSEQQKLEYWIGALSEVLTYCGYYSDASALRELARLTPFGWLGIEQMSGFDTYVGGCDSARNNAKDILENGVAWKGLLESKYICTSSGCTERGGPWEAYSRAGTAAYRQGDYIEAEKQLAAAIKEAERFEPEDPRLATSLNNLAILYHAQGRYAEAEPLYWRALMILETAQGREHPQVAASLNNLADFYRAQGRYAEAEPLYWSALAILDTALGPEHPQVAASLNNLADFYRAQGRYAEAEPLFRHALAIRVRALGPEHPDVAESLNNYAAMLRQTGRNVEAVEMEARAEAIRAKQARDNPVR